MGAADTIGARRPERSPEAPFTLQSGSLSQPLGLRGRRRELLPAAWIATAHFAGLLAIRTVTVHGTAAPDASLETVTYLDVPPPTATESPRRVLKPNPLAVSDAVIIPAAQGGVLHPDRAAGFQELAAPKDLAAMPPPDSGSAVDESDYSGRGVVGGVAGGKPPTVLPAALAAELGREGRLTDDLAAGSARRLQPVSIEVVQVKPRLLNAGEIRQRLMSHYPPVLREAGVDGSVTIEFIVDSTGAIEPGSVEAIAATHPLFAKVALEEIMHARFEPGRMAFDGVLESVPVRVRIPLTWAQKK